MKTPGFVQGLEEFSKETWRVSLMGQQLVWPAVEWLSGRL